MTNEELEEVGEKAASLLRKGCFEELTKKHGYALSFNRKDSDAVQEDLETELEQVCGNIHNAELEVLIKHFDSNELILKSLIECDLKMQRQTGILVELILTTDGTIYLEQISSYKLKLDG